MKEYFFGKKEESVPSQASRTSSTTSNKHRLGSQIEVELVNTSGYMWTGPIWMGGNTNLNVVYDTGSDWLVIEGVDCTSCEGDKYDPAVSEGTSTRLATTISERNYGSASLTGYEYTDKVCIRLGTCLNSFEFFLIST